MEARSDTGDFHVAFDTDRSLYRVLEGLREDAPSVYALPWVTDTQRQLDVCLRPPHLTETIAARDALDAQAFGFFLQSYWEKYSGWYALSQLRIGDWRRLAGKCKGNPKHNLDPQHYRGKGAELLLDLMLRLVEQTLSQSNEIRCSHLHQSCHADIQKVRGIIRDGLRLMMRGYSMFFVSDDIYETQQLELDGCLRVEAGGRERHYFFDGSMGKKSTVQMKNNRNEDMHEDILAPDWHDDVHHFVVAFKEWYPHYKPKETAHRLSIPALQVVEKLGAATETVLVQRTRVPETPEEWEDEYIAVRRLLDRSMTRAWEEAVRKRKTTPQHDA